MKHCRRTVRPLRCYPLLLGLAAFSAGIRVQAQVQLSELPDSPGRLLQQQSTGTSAAQHPAGSASIAGVVVDPSGAAVENASVTLLFSNGTIARSLVSGVRGEFDFEGVKEGSYRVSVSSPGFATYSSGPIELAAGQMFALPDTALAVAAADIVQVNAFDTTVAEAQIRAEVSQRVLGVFPNFYVSYVSDPAPLTTRQKYRLFLHDTFDPANFLGTAIGAGIQQADGNFAGYGEGAAGYGKRYAALFGDGLFDDLLSHAVFPSLFHEDPRYFYQGTGSKKSRLKHALSFAFVTRSDDGRTVPNYSYILGNLGSGALSNLYYPHANRGVGLVFVNAALGVAGQAGGAVVEEFVSTFVTTNARKNRQ